RLGHDRAFIALFAKRSFDPFPDQIYLATGDENVSAGVALEQINSLPRISFSVSRIVENEIERSRLECRAHRFVVIAICADSLDARWKIVRCLTTIQNRDVIARFEESFRGHVAEVACSAKYEGASHYSSFLSLSVNVEPFPRT